jgi:hypothetical protein
MKASGDHKAEKSDYYGAYLSCLARHDMWLVIVQSLR